MPRVKKLPLETLGPDDEKERAEKIKRKRMVEAQKARERRANQTPEEVAGIILLILCNYPELFVKFVGNLSK